MSEDETPTADDLRDRGFQEACALEDLRDVMPTAVEVEGKSILLCRTDEGIHAVDEICPHKNKSMRYGVVHGDKIICPHHRYMFELETGRCNRRRCAPVEVYETAVADEAVWVRVA